VLQPIVSERELEIDYHLNRIEAFITEFTRLQLKKGQEMALNLIINVNID
jgi:hypothetical protein